MGIAPPLTAETRLGSMRDSAFELSNKAGDTGWYGTKALEALDSGDSGMASLALSMGMLSNASGSQYLVPGTRKEISEKIIKREAIPRPQLSRYLDEVHSATILVESARLEREAPLVGTQERRSMAETIRLAATEIRERASDGDLESARRLIEMADGYSRLVKANGWKAWPGSSEMAAGLREELKGNDGTAAFEAGLAVSSFAGETKEFRAEISKWGHGLSSEKEAVSEALSKVDELAGSGGSAEARRVLSCAVMYADAVVRLSNVGRGSPSEIDGHVPPGILVGMESSLSAIISGDVAGKSAEDAFMAGYSACMQTYATLRASSLSSLMRTRPAGQETIKAALEESRSRSAAGDFPGAISLLTYVEEFYGPRTPKAAAGWRYDQLNSKVDGFSRGRDGMVQAIAAELRASKQDGHASAERLFDSSLSLISSTQNMVAGFGVLKDMYSGKVPMLPKVAAGEVPLGNLRKDGTYQVIPLEQVKRFEADPSMKKGPRLEKLLDDCRAAAQSGDADAYGRAVKAFNERFGLVTNGAVRARAFSDAAKQVDQAMLGIGQMREVYGSGKGRDDILVALGLKAIEIRDKLAKGKFPEAELASLISDLGTERKLAMGVSLLNQQIGVGDEYSKYARSENEPQTVAHLARSMESLLQAKSLLIAGKADEARGKYEAAMHYRTNALISYSAENAVNLEVTATAHRRRPGPSGIDERFFPAFWYKRQEAEFGGYFSSMMGVFDSMVGGELTKQARDAGRGSMLVESSIFGVPANAPSQFLDSFRREQGEVRNRVLHGDLAGAERIVKSMQERAETNRWVANAALIGVGLGTAFIPVVGVWISGSIFTGMAVDRIATEYRRDGHASTEAWLMLGLTVGTLGIGVAASATARMANLAGTAARTSRLLSLSKGFTYANIGVGSFMFGYMGASTWSVYQDYKAGNAHSRDVILSAGMTLFPVVHMTVSGVSAYRARTVAARAGQILPTDPEFDPTPGRFNTTEVQVPGFDSPEGIFGFMQRLSGQDPLAVAQFGRLPAPTRSALVSWMSKQGPVRTALEAGTPNDLAMRGIRDGMPQHETRAQADMVLLTDRAQLAGLLRDILNPGKTPGELSQRNAAHATLERIRASNPDAARYIDRLVNDEAYSGLRLDLLSGKPLSQRSVTILQNNSVLIGAELPQEMRPIAAAMGEREPTRASAGDESGRKTEPRMGSVTPTRGESVEVEGTSKAPETTPKEKIKLTVEESKAFVDNPKTVVRGLGLDPVVEDIAVNNIAEDRWLDPANKQQAEMNRDRALVYAEMDKYFRDAAKELGWSQDAINQYSKSFISLLDISERNGYTTYGHSMRVAEYTDMVLRGRADISPKEKAKIRLAALIHDVGKIGVANDLWRFPSIPPDSDKILIDAHSTHSKTIADGLYARIGIVNEKEFKDISTMAGYHQEYYDGTKHNHVKGNNIPLGTRIISIADTYDAMTSNRSYRKALPSETGINQIQKFRDIQFDRKLADEFVERIKEKGK